jgi:hypothetical protein
MRTFILTAAIFGFSWASAEAQHPPGWVACEFKWQDAGKPADYKKFMNDCVASSERRGSSGATTPTPADSSSKPLAERKFDTGAIAAVLDSQERSNYRPITFQDFKLDGKDLAANHTKIRLQGFYQRFGNLDTLHPSGIAVAAAREYGSDNGIPLLTDDATRAARKIFLECGDNPVRPLGCPITISGHAAMCTVGSLLASKSVPCVVVEDGR